MAVNHSRRERFPSKTWTSIAVLYNPSMPLHRDILFWKDEFGLKMKTGKHDCARNKKWIEAASWNVDRWKSIAECGLLQHIRLKRSSMLLRRTSTSLLNLAFQFLSNSKLATPK